MEYVIVNRELYHHGIKGMKWGVRRYQNKDGSYTAAGKRRERVKYADEAKSMSDQELRSKISRMNLEKRYYSMSGGNSRVSNALGGAERGLSAASKAGKINENAEKLKGRDAANARLGNQVIGGASKTVSAAKKITDVVDNKRNVKRNQPKLESMTDKDLETMVNRMDLERQYSSLRKESVTRGKVTASEVLAIAGDLLAVGASATAIAVSIQTMRKNAS